MFVKICIQKIRTFYLGTYFYMIEWTKIKFNELLYSSFSSDSSQSSELDDPNAALASATAFSRNHSLSGLSMKLR